MWSSRPGRMEKEGCSRLEAVWLTDNWPKNDRSPFSPSFLGNHWKKGQPPSPTPNFLHNVGACWVIFLPSALINE